jgi:hypothetical protein
MKLKLANMFLSIRKTFQHKKGRNLQIFCSLGSGTESGIKRPDLDSTKKVQI